MSINLYLELVLVALLALAIGVALRRGPPTPRRRAEGSGARPRVFGLPHEDVALRFRRRTLKICPDCRELVLLDAVSCKHCGSALSVEPAVAPELSLRPRDADPGTKHGRPTIFPAEKKSSH